LTAVVVVIQKQLSALHQPKFARCLTVSWAGTLYIHFRRLLPPDGI